METLSLLDPRRRWMRPFLLHIRSVTSLKLICPLILFELNKKTGPLLRFALFCII